MSLSVPNMTLIVELSPSDIPHLRAFILDAWRLAGHSALGWAGATEENIEEISSESFLHRLVDNPNLKVFVGKTGENVVGFCVTRKIDDQTVELAGIIVRQDQLGKGIGSDLFKLTKRRAVECGFATMIVKTESTNERALSFYRKKEFVEEKQVVEELINAKVNLTVLKLDLKRT
jgi:ribosomal protein S18 acetylase RimI-like enzyme